jgi:hypothetical protein
MIAMWDLLAHPQSSMKFLCEIRKETTDSTELAQFPIMCNRVSFGDRKASVTRSLILQVVTYCRKLKITTWRLAHVS